MVGEFGHVSGDCLLHQVELLLLELHVGLLLDTDLLEFHSGGAVLVSHLVLGQLELEGQWLVISQLFVIGHRCERFLLFILCQCAQILIFLNEINLKPLIQPISNNTAILFTVPITAKEPRGQLVIMVRGAGSLHCCGHFGTVFVH